MKSLKFFSSKPFSPKTLILNSQARSFSSLAVPTPTILSPLTKSTLLQEIESSQRHFIEHLSPHLTPSILSSVLTSLDLTTRCHAICILCTLPPLNPFTHHLLHPLILTGAANPTSILDELARTRERLNVDTTVVFDLLIRAYCVLNKPDEALECFYLMKEKRVLPMIETCNRMLSLFLKLDRTQMALDLYNEITNNAEIKPSVFTLNIIINALCKEGKLEKAKELIGNMKALGLKPGVLTYNILIHKHCAGGKFEEACALFRAMNDEGIQPDCFTYSPLISGMCKEGRLEEASDLLHKMLESGLVPNDVTYNALIRGFCSKGDLPKAFAYRDDMISRGIEASLFTYNV